jgi:hypothetical protein
MPIYYMTYINGWAHDKWDSTGMLVTEASLCVAGAVVFTLFMVALGARFRSRPA